MMVQKPSKDSVKEKGKFLLLIIGRDCLSLVLTIAFFVFFFQETAGKLGNKFCNVPKNYFSTSALC